MLQQLVAILAVAVGALASYTATSANERAKWRREHSIRWDERRLEAYASYGRAVKQMARTAARVAAARGLRYETEPMSPEEGLPILTAAESDRAERFESVLLLGDAETVAAARAWHESVWRLEWFARGKLGGDEWERAVDEYDAARKRFYESARRDLGLHENRLPGGTWPPAWVRAADGRALDGAREP